MTGAGVSAASGVPTFRGADGLWKHFRAEELATPEAFARDPASRLGMVRLAASAHRRRASRTRRIDVLAAGAGGSRGFTLITQNVDGLHERAGTARVLRLHGSIWDVGCWHQCAVVRRTAGGTTPCRSRPCRRACPHCGGPLRPGVVWFGEMLDA